MWALGAGAIWVLVSVSVSRLAGGVVLVGSGDGVGTEVGVALEVLVAAAGPVVEVPMAAEDARIAPDTIGGTAPLRRGTAAVGDTCLVRARDNLLAGIRPEIAEAAGAVLRSASCCYCSPTQEVPACAPLAPTCGESMTRALASRSPLTDCAPSSPPRRDPPSPSRLWRGYRMPTSSP